MKNPACVHVAEHPSEPVLTTMGISFDDTKLDPSDHKALPPGIKTALRRLHVNLGHPTTDDLTRCSVAGGGTRVVQRAAKGMRCATCARMSRPRSHRPSRIPTDGERFNERLFVVLCDVVDVRGNRYWWLVAVDQHHVPATRVKRLPRTFSNIGFGGQDTRTCWCATESEAWELLKISLKNSVSGTQVQTTAAHSPWQKGRVEQRIHTLKEVAGKTSGRKKRHVSCQLRGCRRVEPKGRKVRHSPSPSFWSASEGLRRTNGQWGGRSPSDSGG